MALKLKQVYVYQFTTFSLLSNDKDETNPDDMSENEMADELKKYSKKELQKKKKEFHQKIASFNGIRSIRQSSIIKSIDDFLQNKGTNLVSLFESDISQWIEKNKPENIQTLGCNKILLKGVVFLKIYHEEIMKQIISNGLSIDGVEYCVYTSAAGQQRKTKLTLIEQSIMDEYINKKYMCGLSIDQINKTGGLNAGKALAYLALPLSASKPIYIDIDKVIVVDDMELPVNKEVEFIDHENNFDHKNIDLPDLLNMTDGAAMILPSAMKKIEKQLGLDYPLTGFQIRSSWIKGAVFPFNFKTWCQEHNGNSKVSDIFKNSKEYDVIQDDIVMILSKSQLKTWGKYESWQQYKDEFKKQGLSFSVTAINNPDKNNMQMAYQFLQTLDREKVDPEHIEALCNSSIEHYQKLHSDINTILNQFGACSENEVKEPFQEALMLYPSLLNDEWVKQKLESMVAGYKKDFLKGKIETEGFYGYAQPDMYAFCEWLFLGEKEPKGLIPDDYIYCRYYQDMDVQKADVLRSPHLNNEHSIRNISHSEECKKWFDFCGQNIIYSVHDYLMLCVQGDVDGDCLAIIPNDTLIDMVKPHDVLFYRMYKAPAQQITNECIYDTLVNSFSCNKEGESIGYISNAISKCWNQDRLDNDTLDLIKYLTMKSNFTIDFPKTQKNITLPKNIQKTYEEVVQSQFPYIFKYIKGKKSVAEPNNSVMSQLVKYIESNTKGCRYTYDVEDFDYSMLQSRNMKNEVQVDRSGDKYSNLQKLCYQFGSKVQSLSKNLKSIQRNQNKEDVNDEIEKNDAAFDLTYSLCQMEMLKIYPDKQKLTDALVDLCYCQKYHIPGINNILWSCCGDIIVNNIAINQKNVNYIRKTRTRMAYCKKDIEKIEVLKSKLDELLISKKPVIYQHDIEIIDKIQNEKYRKIYYVILCLCKIYRNKNGKFDHKVYISCGKKSKINNNKLLKMAGLPTNTPISTVLKKLKDLDLITIEEPKTKSGKVISLIDYDFSLKTDDIAFVVNNSWNPIIYFTAYSQNKKIQQCAICGNDFIKVKNQKTCNDKCAEILQSNTKKDANNNKKVDIAS